MLSVENWNEVRSRTAGDDCRTRGPLLELEMTTQYLEEWKSAAEGLNYELEHDADMNCWFAWQGDTCKGAFNLDNVSGELE